MGALTGLQLEKHLCITCPSLLGSAGVTASPASADVPCQAGEKQCGLNGLSCSNREKSMGFAQPSFILHFYSPILQTWKWLEDLEGFERCFPRINSSLSGRQED